MTTPHSAWFPATAALHLHRSKHRLGPLPATLECWSGMPRRRRTPGKDGVACILRVVTKDGKTTIEIEVKDEREAVKLAAKILKAGR